MIFSDDDATRWCCFIFNNFKTVTLVDVIRMEHIPSKLLNYTLNVTCGLLLISDDEF